jgi:hypothetical protein
MTLSVADLAAGVLMVPLYAMLCAALYYLAARAKITEFAWSRYPRWLDYYTLCAACSGVLYGVIVAFGIGWYLDVPFLVLPGRFWLTPVVVGLCSLVWTPWLAAKHLAALETTSPPPKPPMDYSPEAYGTDASPTKDADLAYAHGDPDDPDLGAEVDVLERANEEEAPDGPHEQPE